jgi:hypothetical protein
MTQPESSLDMNLGFPVGYGQIIQTSTPLDLYGLSHNSPQHEYH